MDRRDFLKGATAAFGLTALGISAATGIKETIGMRVRMNVMPRMNHSLYIRTICRVKGKRYDFAQIVDEWDMDDIEGIKSHFEDMARHAMEKTFGITNLKFNYPENTTKGIPT